jgi:alpha-tubulin suppressor-like RCC1 family protein
VGCIRWLWILKERYDKHGTLGLSPDIDVLYTSQVWSWGVNDNGSLGRLTANPPEGQTTEDLETQPMLVADLQEEGFRAVRIVAGDCLGLAIDDRGDVRAWGSFRVGSARKDLLAHS